ncbi:hypothetical protein QYM36_014952 [Artemia franciscana]|uniref:Uncharacterized protein n=1 Tax=Artemia franciscana TaxID=6661 RepID=A0AA88KU54_ARTSF|nr:hypothetical protein QYM36_014952 [Artemia franciscana]KAK2707100.1 hypothetical protein QYM36_014952 [Artemia franciscana]
MKLQLICIYACLSHVLAESTDITNPENDPEFIREPKLIADQLHKENQVHETGDDSTQITESVFVNGTTDPPVQPEDVPKETFPKMFSGNDKLETALESLKDHSDKILIGSHHHPIPTPPSVDLTDSDDTKLQEEVKRLSDIILLQGQEMAHMREELSRATETLSLSSPGKNLDESHLQTISWLQSYVREIREEIDDLYTAINVTQSLERQAHEDARLDVMNKELSRVRHDLTGLTLYNEGVKSELSELASSVHRLEAMQTSVTDRINELADKYTVFEEVHHKEDEPKATSEELAGTQTTESAVQTTGKHHHIHHHRPVQHRFLLDLHKTVDTLNEKLVDLESKNKKMSEAFENNVKKLGNLSSTLTGIEDSFGKDVSALREITSSLQDNITQVHTRVSGMLEFYEKPQASQDEETEASDENKHEKEKKKKSGKDKSKEQKDKSKVGITL